MVVDKLNSSKFTWKGLALHYGKRKVLTLVADATYRHLFRIRYPNGWTTTPANLSERRTPPMGTLVICWGRRAP